MGIVFDIYEFTSFSNQRDWWKICSWVLDIYEFTPFSNLVAGWGIITTVLDIYEFTSFSNCLRGVGENFKFWISTNLHHSQTKHLFTNWRWSFGYLRIYIILKHFGQPTAAPFCFGYLRIYTILKLFTSVTDCLICFGYLRIYIILKHADGGRDPAAL